MPTENRSSYTEMVSVPEGFMLVERSIWTEKQVEAATACITRLKGVPTMTDRALAMAAIDAAQCTAPDIAFSDILPAPQPHPEPIAWMVGTAFWWTKEEAERDAAVTGLPIVGLGPMTDTGEVERLKQDLRVARAQGRAEVVEMIAQLDAETGLDEFIGSHAIADTGDYGSHWNQDELRQHFNADPAAASELEMCRYSAHQIMQLEREEEQLRTHITTQKSWMDRFVEYLTESGVPEDLLAEYKAITAIRI